MAKEYKIAPAEAKAAIADILAVKGVYWSPGDFDYEGMQTMLKRPAAREGDRARARSTGRRSSTRAICRRICGAAEVSCCKSELVPSRRGRPAAASAGTVDTHASAGAG